MSKDFCWYEPLLSNAVLRLQWEKFSLILPNLPNAWQRKKNRVQWNWNSTKSHKKESEWVKENKRKKREKQEREYQEWDFDSTTLERGFAVWVSLWGFVFIVFCLCWFYFSTFNHLSTKQNSLRNVLENFDQKKTSRMHFRKFRCVCEDVRMRQNVRRLKRRESSGHFTILNIVCDRLLRSFMLVTPTCRRTDQHNNEWSDHYIITCYKSKQRYKFLLSPFCNSVKIWPGVVTISSLASTNTPFSWTQSVERYLSVTSKIKRFKRSQTIESEENKSGPNLRALSSYHLIRSEDLWYIRCKFPNKKLSIKILDLESELIKKEKW